MLSNQLSMFDYREILGNVENRPTDVLSIYVFDSTPGMTPQREELRTFIDERSSRIPALRWTIAPSRTRFDFPYWADTAPFVIDDHLSDSTELPSWDAFQRFLEQISGNVRNLSESLWKIHVVRGICDAPGVRGDALVLVLQASHGLGDGRVYNAIARELFSSSTLPEFEPHLRSPNHWSATIGGLLKTPYRYAKAFRALPKYRQWNIPAWPAASVAFSGRRALGVVTLDGSRFGFAKQGWPGTTVTGLAQTIVALTLDEYFGDASPRSLWIMAAAPPSVAIHGRNRIWRYEVPTARELELAERITVMSENNTRAKDNLPEMFRACAALWQTFPATAVRSQPLGDARLGVTISSIDRGPATMTLCGAPIVWTADFPYVTTDFPLSHGVYSVGDTLTISVLSGTDAISDMGGYVALLEKNAARVLECLGARSGPALEQGSAC